MSYNPHITVEGGFAVWLRNDTGAPSVKGTLVEASTLGESGFVVCPANDIDPIGAVYDNGVPDGELCRVVVGGIVDVLMTDTASNPASEALPGNWCGVSVTQAGRVDMEAPSPPNQTRHFQETGHCLSDLPVASGPYTNQLARMVMHFN